MKNNIFKHLFLAVTLVLGLVSCEDRDIITLDEVSSPIIMDLSTSQLVLDKNFPGNPALTVNWESSTTNVPVELKYKLEISSAPDFSAPITLATKDKSETIVAFTTEEMNESAKKIGLVPDESQKMYFRVTSFVGNGDMMKQSNITSLDITPYLASPTYDFQDLFLVGASTAAGWDNTADNINLIPLLKTANPNQYTFTGYFKKNITDAGFKIVKVKGSWDDQFGAGASDGALSTDGGSGNLQVPADGYYKLSIDIDALTYTLVPVTVSSPTFSTMSIIGTATGDADIELTQSTFDPHLWMKSKVSLSAGKFKFRANDSWDKNWGTNSEYFGTGTQDGADIPLTAEWIYNVYFNDATGDYTVIPVK